MIDLHIIHAIGNGVKYYKGNLDAFKGVFNDVSESYAERLHTKLSNMDVQFNSANLLKKGILPLVTTSLAEKTGADEQTLSNMAGGGKKGLYVRQQCDINLFANDLDEVRILHRIIQSTMLIFQKDFLELGYLSVDFEKSKDLEPADESLGAKVDKLTLVGDGLVVFNRELQYSALRLLLAEPLSVGPATFSNWVLDPEINNDI